MMTSETLEECLARVRRAEMDEFLEKERRRRMRPDLNRKDRLRKEAEILSLAEFIRRNFKSKGIS